MRKLVYEKPQMLIEGFVATQSVAANCEYTAEEVPEAVGVKPNDPGCTHGDGGHKVVDTVLNYDKDGNGTVMVFTSKLNCELRYDVEAGSDIATLGRLINGTGCFNSDQHKMLIGDYQVFS